MVNKRVRDMSAGSALGGTELFYADDGSSDVKITANQIRTFAGKSGWKNVLDYGAVGDGVADDTIAIQAAIDDVSGAYTTFRQGTIFFPTGTYNTTATLTFDGGGHIRFLGEAGAHIFGDFNGFIFYGAGGFNYSSHAFENLVVENTDTTAITSGCIKVDGAISLLVKACTIGAGGIGLYQGTAQDVTADTCVFVTSSSANSIGFMAGNAAVSTNCDYVGWAVGLRHRNFGLNVTGGRFEVNTFGIQLGLEVDGTNFGSQGVLISGLSMESNSDTCIYVSNAGAAVVAGCAVSGTCLTGVNVVAGNAITVTGIIVSGVFTTGIKVGNTPSGDPSVFNINVMNCSASAWDVQASVNTVGWFGNEGFARKEVDAFNSSASTPAHQIVGATQDRASMSLTRYDNSTGSPQIALAKSRGTLNTTGDPGYTVVSAGDLLGRISFQGSDGTDFAVAGVVICTADDAGSPGSNDMPGRLEFWTTPDASATPVARWYIDMVGDIRPDATTGGFIRTPSKALTIASGAVTATANYHVIDTEAAAASDDLDTINGGRDGARLIIRAANSARDVVIKDGTGNIQCSGDFTLNNVQDTIELVYDGTLSAWLEIGRSDNGA